MVFRSPNVNVDIPVTAADANPLKANAQWVLRADTKAQESIGTLPVSAKVVGGAAGSVELSSNVSNVWNQIKPQFENRAVANRLQQAVNNYEANAVGTLSSSTKGWAPAITAATLETPPSRPETLAKLQDSVATFIASPPGDATKNDFALAAKLYTASDPDQLFGNYGPAAVNWSLDDLKRFNSAVCSVASINYFGENQGKRFSYWRRPAAHMHPRAGARGIKRCHGHVSVSGSRAPSHHSRFRRTTGPHIFHCGDDNEQVIQESFALRLRAPETKRLEQNWQPQALTP